MRHSAHAVQNRPNPAAPPAGRRGGPATPRPGFTLLAQLGGNGILAILVAVLFPALSRAKQQANTPACLSNLRQLGIAYQMYANSNGGYLPYCTFPSWSRTPGYPSDKPVVKWYEALSKYLGDDVEYDAQGNRITPYARILGNCPSWNIDLLGIPNTPQNDYLLGYGQNLQLFLGSGQAAVGSEKPAIVPYGDPSGAYCGIGNNTQAPSINYAVGAVKQNKIPKAAKTILNGDSVNWHLLVLIGGFPSAYRWNNVQIDQNLPKGLILDDGAPDRHGGRLLDVVKNRQTNEGIDMHFERNVNTGAPGNLVNGGRASKVRANYLFVDGHAETLSADAALKALITRN